MKLYPLTFNPVFSYRIWGGEKLRNKLGKNYAENSIGESWEISAVKDNETTVAQGPLQGKKISEVLREFGSDLVGEKVYEEFGVEFPLLIKYIDAAKPLSIQVHPSDELAKQRHDSFGKNEMWYVMEAEEKAELILGFQEEIDHETYGKLLEAGELSEALNNQRVKRGDTFYIPTGRVHAIGAGVMLAEIQQTSDITYRIYDYDRVDAKTGKTRELHTEQALEAIDFTVPDCYDTQYEKEVNTRNKLVHSPYFKTDFIRVEGQMSLDFRKIDSFVILMCVAGKARLVSQGKTYDLPMGQTILLPAILDEADLYAKSAELLEVHL
jgi:mannose-6-phosphate isomerase